MAVNPIIVTNFFFVLMLFFLVATIVAFFKLDIKKAWEIVTGRKGPIYSGEQEIGERLTQKISTTDLLKKDMLEKSIAMQLDNATTLLVNQHGSNKEEYIVVDINCIHTEVVL